MNKVKNGYEFRFSDKKPIKFRNKTKNSSFRKMNPNPSDKDLMLMTSLHTHADSEIGFVQKSQNKKDTLIYFNESHLMECS